LHNKIENRFADLITSGNYVMTLHAFEEMEDDDLDIFDIENVILNGKIVEKQKDLLTGELKYRFKGQTLSNGIAETVLKFGFNGKAVIITVFKTRRRIL
jgi:hypothetical protein